MGTQDAVKDQDNYCRWANCGDECPSGFSEIVRADDSKLIMSSDAGCLGGFRRLCYPKQRSLPKCRWRGIHDDGKCTPGCNSGEVEIGSEYRGCTKSGYQSACCEETASTAPYGQCKWIGEAPNCSPNGKANDCPSDYPNMVIASEAGSGGMSTCSQGVRSYCCRGNEVPKPFQNCLWQKDFKSGVVALSILCDDSCPPGQIQLARTQGPPGSCWLTSWGLCCSGAADDDIEKRSYEPTQTTELRYYLEKYLANPTCLADRGLLRRATHSTPGLGYNSFMRLVDMLAMAFKSKPMPSSMRTMLEIELNADRRVASINEIQGWVDNGGMSNDFFANFLCDMEGTTTGIRDRRNVESTLCELPRVSRRTESKRQDVDDPGNEHLGLLQARTFGIGNSDRDSRGSPNIRTAFQGVLNGELSLHYARWVENNRVHDIILEIAYWIGPQVGVNPSRAIRDRYNDAAGNRHWIVFHIHFPQDPETVVRDAVTRNQPDNDNLLMFRRRDDRHYLDEEFYAGASGVNVFHSSSPMQYVTGGVDSRVEWRQNLSSGSNARTVAMNCRRINQNARWYVGRGPPPTTTNADGLPALLDSWGRHLHSQGIVDMHAFAWIYTDRQRQARATTSPAMSLRTLRPYDGAFEGNWISSANDAAWVRFENLRDRISYSSSVTYQGFLDVPDTTDIVDRY